MESTDKKTSTIISDIDQDYLKARKIKVSQAIRNYVAQKRQEEQNPEENPKVLVKKIEKLTIKIDNFFKTLNFLTAKYPDLYNDFSEELIKREKR